MEKEKIEGMAVNRLGMEKQKHPKKVINRPN
jgi:hypothetical protein